MLTLFRAYPTPTLKLLVSETLKLTWCVSVCESLVSVNSELVRNSPSVYACVCVKLKLTVFVCVCETETHLVCVCMWLTGEVTVGQLLACTRWLRTVYTGFLITAVTAGHGDRPRWAESGETHKQRHDVRRAVEPWLPVTQHIFIPVCVCVCVCHGEMLGSHKESEL